LKGKTMPLVRLEEPQRAARGASDFALWQLGFRPFYLLASAFAALSIALWALQLAGWLGRPYLAGPIWHAHEMLFGFGLAVVVGFLLTAARNWSGQPTPSGLPLALLAALWLAGRVLVLTPFGWLAAAIDTAFPLAAAAALARPLVAASSRRNYFFVALLLALALASLAVHLAQLRALDLPGRLGIQAGLDLLLFVMVVMGGRVIPMFTNNGVRGATARRERRLEALALGGVLSLLGADLAGMSGALLAALLALLALAHLGRWLLWQPWKTRRAPLVWVLHLAYAWIIVHLALRALAALGWVAPSLAAHALTVGAIGALTLGMMTRTARGHTARPLVADGWEVACYLLVLGAALLRVAVPLAAPALLMPAVLGSALLWSAAFGLYFVRYWPILTRPRLDGRPG
jgi:uncharacterized protein involved in response to NO